MSRITVCDEDGVSVGLAVVEGHARLGAASGRPGGGQIQMDVTKSGAELRVGRQAGAVGSAGSVQKVTADNNVSLSWKHDGSIGLELNDADGKQAAVLHADEYGHTTFTTSPPPAPK